MGVFRSTKRKSVDVPYSKSSEDSYYPSITFYTDELPEIALWQPGEEYELTIKVKQISKEVYKDEKEAKEQAMFDVIEVAATGDGDAYSKVAKKLNLK